MILQDTPNLQFVEVLHRFVLILIFKSDIGFIKFPYLYIGIDVKSFGINNFQTVMMKRFFIILIIILSTFQLIAQGRGFVTGIILDTETGKPMVAVNISANKRSGTVSDQEGNFLYP
jgi:hypothetical protein